MKKLLFFILFFLCTVTIFAKNDSSVVENDHSVTIYFTKNSSTLDLNYRNNGETLRSIIDTLNHYISDSVYYISNIHFIGAASPDGNRVFNERLAERRARVVYEYLVSQVQLPDSVYQVASLGCDWRGLVRLATSDSSLPHQSEVLNLLYNIESDTLLRNPLLALSSFEGGKPYGYMLENYFPLLRAVHLSISNQKLLSDSTESRSHSAEVQQSDTLTSAEEQLPVVEPDTLRSIADTTLIVADTIAESLDCRPFYMALKTNMLYDLAITPNVAIEFYLGKGFSATASWQYAWWKRDKSAFYWRTYGGDAEVRYWFGREAKEKPLIGHHVGVYGQLITYDFIFGRKGILAPRWSWAIGASYGYSLPIHEVLNLDFVLGLGYHSGIFQEYELIDGHYAWQATKRRHWLGPTKAEISLVWLIGCDNYNRKTVFDKKQKEIEQTIEALVGEDKGGAL